MIQFDPNDPLYDPYYTPEVQPVVLTKHKKCDHESRDTGLKWSFCIKCNCDMEFDPKTWRFKEVSR